MKSVWTDFENFEIFMKRSVEKKRQDCIGSRKVPTPKNRKELNSTINKKPRQIQVIKITKKSPSRLGKLISFTENLKNKIAKNVFRNLFQNIY